MNAIYQIIFQRFGKTHEEEIVYWNVEKAKEKANNILKEYGCSSVRIYHLWANPDGNYSCDCCCYIAEKEHGKTSVLEDLTELYKPTK